MSKIATVSDARREPGTVAICFVVSALAPLRERGFNADALLEQVGLSPALLNSAQARISTQHYSALWRLIAQTLDDEFFGQDARRMKTGSFALMCHSLISCRNLRRALERSLRFYGLILDDIDGTLEQVGSDAKLVLHDRSAAPHREFAHEVLLMLLHGVACWLVGKRIPIKRAQFAYVEPAYSLEYRAMYSAVLEFRAPQTAIFFDASYLDLPIVQNERTVKEFLRLAPENILVKYKNGSSLGARIRRRLRLSLPGELPEFEALALEMNMTPATLRRRLHEDGTSYQAIKDQLRRDIAIGHLSHSKRSTMDIGLELGFSERSAFHRAFKKWTGAAPGEFRRRLQP